MKRVNYLFAAICIIALSFGSCSKESGIKNGKLSGTSWSYYRDDSNAEAVRGQYTYTISFTSETAGKRTETGWMQSRNPATWQWKDKVNINETKNFTYVYTPELKEGLITYSSSNQSVFFISDNFKELTFGGWVYTLK